MMQTTSIYEPIQQGLTRVEASLKTLGSDLQFPFLSEVLGHVFDTTGKAMRPAITLLSASFHPHEDRIIEIMATAVELLHIASLIHDDTVDESSVRRGQATIGSLWGRNVAILVGDYIFAASATHVCDTGNVRVIRRFSETIMELSRGELSEMVESYGRDQTREQYLRRIYNKTASLFTTAGESGAILSGAPEDVVQALKAYGYNLGIAFQMVDDILDFEGTQEEIGKPVGSDLAHGIMTLPAIRAIELYPNDKIIDALFRDPDDPVHLERAVEMIQNSSAVSDSYGEARDFCAKAVGTLDALPRNVSRESLEGLVEYVVERRR